MLLQNRNAFGHAFIKDIAGNAGDKPLQSDIPQIRRPTALIAVFHAAIASPENETPKMALGDREPK